MNNSIKSTMAFVFSALTTTVTQAEKAKANDPFYCISHCRKAPEAFPTRFGRRALTIHDCGDDTRA
ncbi:hypothetical protein ACMUMJ_01175 [Marinomonas sp. 2405UD68-3]